MRLSYRVGLAGLFILAIVLIKRNLETIRDDSRVQPFWELSLSNNGAGSPEPSTRPENNVNANNNNNNNDNNVHSVNHGASDKAAAVADSGKPKQGGSKPASTEEDSVQGSVLEFETTPVIVPDNGVVVMARLSSEDTSWVGEELAEWKRVVYTVDDVTATKHTPVNKGRESLAYLQYIIEHYNDLPTTIIFLHSHKDGWPAAWHTDTIDYNNVQSVRALKLDYVQQTGYVNLRCQETPGCPDGLKPFRNQAKPGKTTESVYAQAWAELFNNTDVPEVIGVPCCSQFAVSRDQVLKRPLTDYYHFYEWVLTTELSDELTAHVMENTWHIIFGQNPVYCPDVFQCYEDVYGNSYFW